MQNKHLEKLKGSSLLKNTQVEKTDRLVLSLHRNTDLFQLRLFFPLDIFVQAFFFAHKSQRW